MSVYSTTHQVSTPLNGIGGMSDGSGTINPAALSSSGTGRLWTWPSHCRQLSLPASIPPFPNLIFATGPSFLMAKTDLLCVTAVPPQPSIAANPRGIKRSRSPDQAGDSLVGEEDDGMCRFPTPACSVVLQAACGPCCEPPRKGHVCDPFKMLIPVASR